MSRSVTITVPGTPDICLSPNRGRTHYRKIERHRKALRDTTIQAVWGSVVGTGRDEPYFTGPVKCYITIAWGQGRGIQDRENATAMLKGLIDGLTQAKVWVDDSPKWLTLDPVAQVKVKELSGWIQVIVTEAEAA